jgi:alanine racemase
MCKNSHPAWIEVDLQQFRRNLAAIRKKIGGRLLCLPVKANAYGHGLCEMGRAAAAAGVDYLGVSCLKEGRALRAAGLSLPILVFGAIHEDQIHELIQWNLELSVSSRYKAELVLKECIKLNERCRVHLEVDTGMQRTGVRPDTAVDLLSWLLRSDAFEVVGVYSHLATADTPAHPFALKQIAQMRELMNRVGQGHLLWHLANSGGVMHYPESHFDMVRPGLVCYGYLPDGKPDPMGEIAPCLALKAKVSYFKVVGAGEGVSYGHLYRTSCQTRMITVPVGYGDGYRRILSNQGRVAIRGKRYQIAGAICMDQFMVDIGMDEVFVGDEVTLIGKDVRLEDLSQLAQMIPYELLCGLNDRLPRLYLA